MILGCIGDDFTGSSDLANTLAKGGMHVVQYSGVPSIPADTNIDAGVVALKSRTAPVAEAVEQSLRALEWLRTQGCQQFFFKYCSTFDSTPEGNIGPVADALAEALGATRVVVCPAFPAAGRTIYQGHLFVNSQLLNESGMQQHPLTPMTDPDLRRWLSLQSKNKVGHIGFDIVSQGSRAIRTALDKQAQAGNLYAVVDALEDKHLYEIGAAAEGLPLITGGSGVALGLPELYRKSNQISSQTYQWVGNQGAAVAISGSCSETTRRQVAHHSKNYPSLKIDPADVMAGEVTAEQVADFLISHIGNLPIAYSSAEPQSVKQAQAQFGREELAKTLEALLADTAKHVVAKGVSRLITAGGESSGAIVEGLDIEAMEIGPEIDPGVPAMKVQGRNLVLVLKSGNFGGLDFFEKAARVLEGA